MTSDNSKSQIDFLDLKIMKIIIQALVLLRFNFNSRFETLLFDSPAFEYKMNQKRMIIEKYLIKHAFFVFLNLIFIFFIQPHVFYIFQKFQPIIEFGI